MRKLAFLPMLLLVFAAGCEDDPPTQPTPNAPTFAMSLLSSNEPNFPTPSEASCAGTVRIQLNLTRDAAQVITAATVDFTGTVTGCPTTTTITVAHIHEGAPGVVGPVRVDAFPSGTVTLVGGAGSFSRLGIVAQLTPALAQQIIDNPGAFYFNIHSSGNPQGVIRAPLVRTN
jgi:CHRD domain-containing protein